MRLYVGTSGFAYKSWRGAFYPEGIRESDLLAWYAGQFDAVEINSTFYRFPTTAGLANWAAQVPGHFRFALKVPQRITHIKRLRGIHEDIGYLVDTVTTLGPRLGPLLFQFSPQMPLDVTGLEELIVQLLPGLRAAFEFRHPSWFCKEVFLLLERHGHALCFNDENMVTLHATTDWGYLRLRRGHYSNADLTTVAEQVLTQPWCEAYVFFKHEAPDAPQLAHRWSTIASAIGKE